MGHVDHGKCVSGETNIFLADGTTPKIMDLFAKFEHASKKIIDDNGMALELKDNLFVLGEENGAIKALPISHIWKMEKKDLIETKLANGFEIKTTPEHPFLVLNENMQIHYKQAKDIQKNDFIAVPKKTPKIATDIKKIKELFLEKLSQNNGLLAFVKNEFANEFSPMIKSFNKEGLITKQIRDCIDDKRFRVRDLFLVAKSNKMGLDKVYDSIEFIKYSTQKQRASHRGVSIKLPKKENEFKEFFYVLGLIFGDGCGSDLRLSNNDMFLLEKYKSFFEQAAGVKSTIVQARTSKDAYNYGWKTFREMIKTLFNFPTRKKSHKIKVSELIEQMPNEFVSEFISGYFDTDGYVQDKCSAEISTVSEEMANGLSRLLLRFGIIPYIRKNKNSYRIIISGKTNISNFIGKTGFKLKRKKELLEKNAKNAVANRAIDILPVTGKKLKEIRIEHGINAMETKIPFQKTYEKYNRLSTGILSVFVNKVNDLTSTQKHRKNIQNRTIILELLKNQKTYREIYSQISIEHKILLNELLWMTKDGLISKKENTYIINEYGKEVLALWKKKGEKISSVLENITTVLQSEMRFVKVTENKLIKNEDDFVYDLTQPKSHNFIANNIIVHNTKLLDAIRGTAVAEKEAGQITQHIGATEVPISVIERIAGPLLKKYGFELKIPGLLFIDTPGHEAFTNLRRRGGSIADLAVIVVDISQGMQNQTIEAVEILKSYKTPFIVVANKIDTIYGWIKTEGSFTQSIEHQHPNALELLDKKIYELVGQFYSHGFVTERFDRVKDFSKEIAIIPASAKFFEGIPEVLLFLAGLSQKYLGKKLAIGETEKAKGTILEVKEEQGLGKTIDIILYEGKLVVGEEIVVGGKNGAIVTKIRALLEPGQAGEKTGLKEKFKKASKVFAATGVKIAAPNLEEAVPGAPVRQNSEAALKEVTEEILKVKIDTQNIGPVLKADTLGSLEAMIKLLEAKKIRIRKADVGVVSKHDVIEASAVKEKDDTKGVVFAFHTKVNEDAKSEAKKRETEIFEDKVIYNLIENYLKWVEQKTEEKKKKTISHIVFPSRVFVMPNHVFRNSKPAIVGIRIEQGRLKTNVQLMKNGKIIGKVNAIQMDGKTVEEAKPRMEVAVSVSGATVGRSFNENDELYSYIPKKQLEELVNSKGILNEDEIVLLEKIRQLEKKELEED